MPSNLLILALLAGFIFVHRCHSFRFRAQMLDGYRLLFHCSVGGAVLLVISRSLVCSAKLSMLFWAMRPYWLQVVNVAYFGTFLLCIPLAWLTATVWNWFVDPEKQRKAEVLNSGDSLIILIQQALDQDRMISITLGSRKWYAGYIAEAPRPGNRMFFRLIPILSGYRDPDTLRAYRTLSYDQVYEGGDVDPADFAVTIPLASIQTASLFDPSVYKDHFAKESDEREQEMAEPEPRRGFLSRLFAAIGDALR